METGSKALLQRVDVSDAQRIVAFYGTDFLYLSVWSEKGRRLATEHYTFNRVAGDYLLEKIFTEFFSKSDILRLLNDIQVDIYPSHAPYTLVPSTFFQESEKRTLLQLECELPLSSDVIALPVDSCDSILLTAVPQQLHRFFASYFTQFSWCHPVADRLNKVQNSDREARVWVYGMNDRFDVLIYGNQGQLLLANSYPFKTAQDFIYFLLFALEQTGMDRMAIPVLLDGFIMPDSPIFELAHTYIRYVRVAKSAASGDALTWLGPENEPKFNQVK